MKGALASAGGFIAGYLMPALLFMMAGFGSRAPITSGRAVGEEVMLFLYYVGVYALAGAIAYAAITAASRNWRQRSPGQVALVSALAGAFAQILNWTGLALIVLLPLTRVFPHNFAMVLGVAMPGVVVGGAVVLWTSSRRTEVSGADSGA